MRRNLPNVISIFSFIHKSPVVTEYVVNAKIIPFSHSGSLPENCILSNKIKEIHVSDNILLADVDISAPSGSCGSEESRPRSVWVFSKDRGRNWAVLPNQEKFPEMRRLCKVVLFRSVMASSRGQLDSQYDLFTDGLDSLSKYNITKIIISNNFIFGVSNRGVFKYTDGAWSLITKGFSVIPGSVILVPKTDDLLMSSRKKDILRYKNKLSKIVRLSRTSHYVTRIIVDSSGKDLLLQGSHSLSIHDCLSGGTQNLLPLDSHIYDGVAPSILGSRIMAGVVLLLVATRHGSFLLRIDLRSTSAIKMVQLSSDRISGFQVDLHNIYIATLNSGIDVYDIFNLSYRRCIDVYTSGSYGILK